MRQFQSSVAFHIKISHLICSAIQITGILMRFSPFSTHEELFKLEVYYHALSQGN